MSGAVYTYAVAHPFDVSVLAGLRGIDGHPVRLVRHRELVAVVSALDAASADEAGLRARLEDLAQLEALARAHHAVVEAVAAQGSTLPLRLGTLHHGEARAAEALRDGYETFCAVLRRLAGRVELGVKVHALARDAAPAERGESEGAPSDRPGRNYLRRLQGRRQRQEDVRRRAGDAAGQLDAALGELAVDRRHHRPQAGELGPADGENVLNAAYLVDRPRVKPFVERARALAARDSDVRVEVTGPWAPYSFVDAPPSEAGADDDGRGA